MKIGILQTGHVAQSLRTRHGDYDAIFPAFLADQELDFENFAVVDGQFPPGPDAADGWLITGSKHGAYEPHSWIPPLEKFIRACYANDVPMVGICFGHQIIAQALGGTVEKFDGGWAVGPQHYRINGQTHTLHAWHQDQVTVLPDGCEVVCTTDFCTNAAMIYGTRAFTVQPHPEFKADYVAGLLEVRAPGVVPEDLRRDALARLDQPTDGDTFARMIARFFKDKRIA